MKATEYAPKVLKELSIALAGVDDDDVERFVGQIEQAQSVFVAGAGRSGLAIRAFAMRLMHMGCQVYVAGETNTPNITERDLFVIGSGSGSTESLVAIASRAKQKFNARLAVMTIYPQSPIGQLGDVVVVIPALTPKVQSAHEAVQSIQPMGSLFEQSLLLLLDIVVLRLMERSEQESSTMFTRHANLE